MDTKKQTVTSSQGRFLVTKTFRFEAAHRLPYYDGPCKELHGHSYTLRVFVCGDRQADGPHRGMVIDYRNLTKATKNLLDLLDHSFLNNVTVPPGAIVNDYTTAENLAEWIYNELEYCIPGLYAIEVSETDSTSAMYCPHYLQ